MEINRVAVVGMGILGSQIAIQAACHGYEVYGYDEIDYVFAKSNDIILSSINAQKMSPVMGLAEWKKGADKVRTTAKLEEAVGKADLVIEAVPERLDLKKEVFARLDDLAPPHALLASNSSSIPISRIEGATGRPERCVNLHFYFPALGMNMVDVMGGSDTESTVLEDCSEWVRSIGCIPIRLHKEVFGFCLNRMQHAARREAMHMWAEGAVDLEDVDRAWMVWTGMPFGPFGMMDQIGLDVVYNVEMSYYNETNDPRYLPPDILKEMIDQGALGKKAGRGFYSYPDPLYAHPGFLEGE